MVLEMNSELTQSPILIVGALNRSGTNYLIDIVRLLPDCEMPALSEDYLFEHSANLTEYANKSNRRWKRKIGENASQTMIHCIGHGLYMFLQFSCQNRDSRIVIKTPRPEGVQNVFKFFPNARLILIVRDGQDTVESAARSFTYATHSYWMKEWKRGARILLDFLESSDAKENREKFMLLKFEDLVNSPQSVIPKLVTFLGYQEDQFDWKQFENLPVRGSSTLRNEEGSLDWKPVKKTPDFKPVGRSRDWPWWRKQCFRYIAGKEQAELEEIWQE